MYTPLLSNLFKNFFYDMICPLLDGEIMRELQFFIPGSPVGKARARASFRGGKAHFYTPAKTKRFENQVILYARTARQAAEIYAPFAGRIGVNLTLHYKKKKIFDIDNVAKSVLDGMNSVIYHDDKQVSFLLIQESYGHEEEGILVHITEMADLVKQ
jgi:Holliday junction resolvase RusA-like endonuclease